MTWSNIDRSDSRRTWAENLAADIICLTSREKTPFSNDFCSDRWNWNKWSGIKLSSNPFSLIMKIHSQKGQKQNNSNILVYYCMEVIWRSSITYTILRVWYYKRSLLSVISFTVILEIMYQNKLHYCKDQLVKIMLNKKQSSYDIILA